MKKWVMSIRLIPIGGLSLSVATRMVGNPIRRRELNVSDDVDRRKRHLRRSPEMATVNSSTARGAKALAGEDEERRCSNCGKGAVW